MRALLSDVISETARKVENFISSSLRGFLAAPISRPIAAWRVSILTSPPVRKTLPVPGQVKNGSVLVFPDVPGGAIRSKSGGQKPPGRVYRA